MKTGYDRYLEFQFGIAGDFFTQLFRAIQQADEKNLHRLALGFHEEVDAYIVWSRYGRQAFLDKCTQTHGIIAKIKSGEYVL
jgi:hypothetical protein